MELFAADPVVARLEAGFPRGGEPRAAMLAELAWHLRQRDTRRAEVLAREALHASDEAASGPPRERLLARIALVRSECALLFLRMDQASGEAREALARAQAAGDAIAQGDAALAAARIALTLGDRDAERAQCALAREHFARGGERIREGYARAMEFMAHGLAEPERIAAAIAQMRADAALTSLDCLLRHVEAVIAFQRGDFGAAATGFGEVAERARSFGMLELALSAQFSAAGALSNLGDREASAELCERVLQQARAFGWPRSIGGALSHLGRLLFQMGQTQRAIEVLHEAAAALAPLERSRHFAIVRYYLGDCLLALGEHARAHDELAAAEEAMRALGFLPEVASLAAIRAQALSRLGRVGEAVASAEEALAIARRTGARLWESEALRSLAEIHLAHPSADGSRSPRTALALLEEALGVIEALGGHHEKSEVLGEIARVHELTGDLAAALSAERAARAEQSREEHARAANHIVAAQVRHETDRARVEAMHQRELAAAEAERSRALQVSLETLEQVSAVGQAITAHLDAAGMVETLHRHLSALADVSFVGVYVSDASGEILTRHAIEAGRVLPVRDIAVSDLESYSARAARERRELHVEFDDARRAPPPIPGTMPGASLWFAPLLLGERLLGVLTVQSTSPQVYREREKLIFRAVGGYAAVALANARIHGDLAATEAEMRRLATVDALTGLANRRHFFSRAQDEIVRARRYGGAIGLVIVDVDRFKALNDSFGHPAGDRVLAAAAQTLARGQRANDVVARLGGEEFALLLPGASLAECAAVAERLRREIQDLAVEWDRVPMPFTASFGCASVDDARALEGDALDALEWLVQQADGALYGAKQGGRNRVMAATPDLPAAASPG